MGGGGGHYFERLWEKVDVSPSPGTTSGANTVHALQDASRPLSQNAIISTESGTIRFTDSLCCCCQTVKDLIDILNKKVKEIVTKDLHHFLIF